MHPLTSIDTAQHFIRAFSWMLLHSLWQGLLLALVTGVILAFAKRSAASVRYNMVLVQFFLFVAACFFTFTWEFNKGAEHVLTHPLAGALQTASLPFNLNAYTIRAFARVCISYFTANAPMVVLLWFILFVFKSMRMMGSLVYIHRARHRYVYHPPALWTDKVDALCQKLQLNRAVRLLESGYVKMPMVIGHLKPVILIPVGLLAGMPAGQIEAVLLHELAHIRRHDYVVNFMQTIAETIFFFNPGLLWISSLLRDERENCCDDIALSQTKNKKEFVQALISFKEHALYGANYQVAFAGKKNHLLNRVSRILHNKNKPFGPGEKAFFMVGVLILSVIVATAAVAEVRTMAYIHTKMHHSSVYTSDKTTRFVKATKQVTVRSTRYNTHIVRPVAQTEVADMAPSIPPPPPQQSSPDKLTDQQRALIDQEQAKKDQEQARLDMIQAKKDQEQARKDEENAKKEQDAIRLQKDQQNTEQVKRNEEQAKRNAEQAKKNEMQDIRNQEQAKRNQEQAEHNSQQVQLNELQARRNEEQANRNEQQNARNQELATKNQVSVQN